jgi:hypothetical protein
LTSGTPTVTARLTGFTSRGFVLPAVPADSSATEHRFFLRLTDNIGQTSDTAIQTIPITGRPALLQFTSGGQASVNPSSVVVGNSLTGRVRLLDAQGAPVFGHSVRFDIADASEKRTDVGVVLSDPQGYANVTYLHTKPAGLYTLKATSGALSAVHGYQALTGAPHHFELAHIAPLAAGSGFAMTWRVTDSGGTFLAGCEEQWVTFETPQAGFHVRSSQNVNVESIKSPSEGERATVRVKDGLATVAIEATTLTGVYHFPITTSSLPVYYSVDSAGSLVPITALKQTDQLPLEILADQPDELQLSLLSQDNVSGGEAERLEVGENAFVKATIFDKFGNVCKRYLVNNEIVLMPRATLNMTGAAKSYGTNPMRVGFLDGTVNFRVTDAVAETTTLTFSGFSHVIGFGEDASLDLTFHKLRPSISRWFFGTAHNEINAPLMVEFTEAVERDSETGEILRVEKKFGKGTPVAGAFTVVGNNLIRFDFESYPGPKVDHLVKTSSSVLQGVAEHDTVLAQSLAIATPLVAIPAPPKAYMLEGEVATLNLITGVETSELKNGMATIGGQSTLFDWNTKALTAPMFSTLGMGDNEEVVLALSGTYYSQPIAVANTISVRALHRLGDTDGDGLTNAYEIAFGLNPLLVDTDGDGVNDGAEDLDSDGLSNLQEMQVGTNPKARDTDGDGLGDAIEVAVGSDPKSAASHDITEYVTAIAVSPQTISAVYATFETRTVALTATATIVARGQTFEVDATSNEVGVSYQSSDETVATVSGNGQFQIMGAGSATLTATLAGFQATSELTVKSESKAVTVTSSETIGQHHKDKPFTVARGGVLTVKDDIPMASLIVESGGKVLSENTVVVTGNVEVQAGGVIDVGGLEVGGDLLVDGGTVEAEDVNVDGDAEVTNNGKVTSPANTGTSPFELNIKVKGSVSLTGGGTIDVSGKGYGTNKTLGGVSTMYAFGGSHAGVGVYQYSDSIVAAYGDYSNAVHAGAGGGSGTPGSLLSGGGVLSLSSANLVLDGGAILANGLGGAMASGAGGSIWISTGTVSGVGSNGRIEANGGVTNDSYSGGSGGGGRVVMEYGCIGTGGTTDFRYIQARGGLTNKPAGRGGAGTVLLEGSDGHRTLKVSNDEPSRSDEKTSTLVTNLEVVGQWTIQGVIDNHNGTWTVTLPSGAIKADRNYSGYSLDLDASTQGGPYYEITGFDASKSQLVVTTCDNLLDYRGKTLVGVHFVDAVELGGNTSASFGNDRLVAAEGVELRVTTLEGTGNRLEADRIVGLSNLVSDVNTTVAVAKVESGPLSLHGGTVLEVNGQLQVQGDLVLSGGSKLTTKALKVLNIDVTGTVSLTDGGTIDVSGKGYGTNKTLGGVSTMYAFGGSHAGVGAYQYSDSIVAAYGDYSNAVHAGAGGGSGAWGILPNFSGGGVISLSSANLVLDGGAILANGLGGTSTSGAGGSIRISTGTVSGVGSNGRIEANGGATSDMYSGGSGGGGRVVMKYKSVTDSTNLAYVQARGGLTNKVGGRGGAGTVLLERSDGYRTLKVSNDEPSVAGEKTSSLVTNLEVVGQWTLESVTKNVDGTWTVMLPSGALKAGRQYTGYFVDLDASSQEGPYYEITGFDVARKQLTVSSSDDLSGYAGKTLVGVHWFDSYDAGVSTNVSFGNDRHVTKEEWQSGTNPVVTNATGDGLNEGYGRAIGHVETADDTRIVAADRNALVRFGRRQRDARFDGSICLIDA